MVPETPPPSVIMFGLGLGSNHLLLCLRSTHHNSAHLHPDRRPLVDGAREERGARGAEWRCVDSGVGALHPYGTNGIVGWGEQTAQTCAKA
jgi:hypothetical protein